VDKSSLICFLVVYLGIIFLVIAGFWKIFEKAGQAGWKALIPFYNMYVLTCEIAKKEILWFILLFVPFVGIVASILIMIELARKFGKSELFGIGLAFLSPIFIPILGFGSAQYQRRVRTAGPSDRDW